MPDVKENSPFEYTNGRSGQEHRYTTASISDKGAVAKVREGEIAAPIKYSVLHRFRPRLFINNTFSSNKEELSLI